MSLRVSSEDLAAFGLALTTHGEDLAVAHTGADGRLDAELPGWQGRSAAALSARVARWTIDTRELLARIGDHAQGVSAAAAQFWGHDQLSAQALECQGRP